MIFIFLMVPFFALSADIVERRGFVIEGESGRKFLSTQPGIKSCCVAKTAEALELIGDFGELPRYGAVTLKGELRQESNRLQLVSEKLALSDLLPQEKLTE